MKQLTLKSYTRLTLEETDSAPLLPAQVRVRTRYAGLSFTDYIIYKGFYRYQKDHMPLPYVPGFEVVGVVTEIGSDVTTCAVGAVVAILQRSGCLAEEIVALENAVMVLPRDVDERWVAGLPVHFFTAYHALHNIVRVFPGSRMLVEAAAGGVGGLLVQMAARDCSVVGLVGCGEKEAYVRSLGAQEVYTHDRLPRRDRYDVIFSTSGMHVPQYYKQLTANGKIVVFGFHAFVPSSPTQYLRSAYRRLVAVPRFSVFEMVYQNKTVSGFNIIKLGHDSVEYRETRRAFLHEVCHPQLTKHAVHSFPFTAYQEAFEALADRSRTGKVVLEL